MCMHKTGSEKLRPLLTQKLQFIKMYFTGKQAHFIQRKLGNTDGEVVVNCHVSSVICTCTCRVTIPKTSFHLVYKPTETFYQNISLAVSRFVLLVVKIYHEIT